MANVNIVSDASKYQYYGQWSDWAVYNASGMMNLNYAHQFAERFPINNKRISRFTYNLDTQPVDEGPAYPVMLFAGLYTDDPVSGTPIAEIRSSYSDTGTTTFDFSELTLDIVGNLYVKVSWTTENPNWPPNISCMCPSIAAVTYTDIPALTPKIVQPTGTKQGSEDITFAWTISGAGTQTSATLQFSYDNINWYHLTSVGSAQTYTVAPGTFPAGTVFWRIKTKSSYNLESAWVSGSFTVNYALATVTLTTPTSGSIDGGQKISFAWEITKGGGSITGTQMDYSADDGLTWTSLVDSGESVTRYNAAAGELPAGKILWRVRAKDSYAGWGAYKQATITISYAAISQVVPVNTPTSGIYNAAAARDFTVALQASDIVHTPFTVASATMYWRSGESGDFTAVSMTPDETKASVTIPAGTFPSGIIQWYAEATDNTGRTTRTETYTLTTLNAAVEATPISPISTLESGSGPITFIWTYGSIDGAPQGKAEVRYSTDGGTSWTTLPVISGSVTRAEIPAGTFPAGTITWQIRAYNEAGTEGPWSASVSFISFSAPLISAVLGDGKPFLTVSWQVDAQQAYEVEVNGKTYGPYYGENVRSFTLPEPLPDGSYTARVRAQNRYSLWSEWAEGNVDVTNVPGATVPIGATNGVNVDLSLFLSRMPPVIIEQPQDLQTTDKDYPRFRCRFLLQPAQIFNWRVELRATPQSAWQDLSGTQSNTLEDDLIDLLIDPAHVEILSGYEFRFCIWPRGDESMIVYSRAAKFVYAEPTLRSPLITGFFPSEYGYFLIYRDGELIGKTYQTPFVDRTALGTHKYYALQVLADGYYTRSSPYPVTGTASVKCPMIAPLDGGEFIPLRLSENSRRTVNFSRRRQVAYTQYAGAAFPAAEVGENETLTASFDVAYRQTDKAAADAFEDLLGRDVILKSPGGQVVVGVLEGYDINDNLRFYKAYRCTLQQMDWGDFVDETGSV